MSTKGNSKPLNRAVISSIVTLPRIAIIDAGLGCRGYMSLLHAQPNTDLVNKAQACPIPLDRLFSDK